MVKATQPNKPILCKRTRKIMYKYILVLISILSLTNCEPVRIEGTVIKKEKVEAHWYEETPIYVIEAGFSFYPHAARVRTTFHSSRGRSTPKVKTSPSYSRGHIYGVYPRVMWHSTHKKYWVSTQFNLFVAPKDRFGEQVVSVDSITFVNTKLKDKVCFDDDKRCRE